MKKPKAKWNPDKAGEEMRSLFDQADAIMNKQIYHDEPKPQKPKANNPVQRVDN